MSKTAQEYIDTFKTKADARLAEGEVFHSLSEIIIKEKEQFLWNCSKTFIS